MLPAADASIIPMKGGGSEATDFYTKFAEVLNLDGYFISIKDGNITLTSRELTRFYRKTQAEKSKEDADKLVALRAKEAEKAAATKKALEDADAAKKALAEEKAAGEALKARLRIAEATDRGIAKVRGGSRILGRSASKSKLNASVE
jgi:hypothetical protein